MQTIFINKSHQRRALILDKETKNSNFYAFPTIITAFRGLQLMQAVLKINKTMYDKTVLW